ncbi:hypothetical protein CCMSSC00406_0004635 [Pleurotus cornucopiae]|uniref:Uncharacterized protein n=1 Tax=Pleurotus cornucopiae TaxID=5321 RepID=A0ACB7IYJ5_PLECO|nr:hypothetical protein CCMSSC00406_0004635 [Pleurotus cornucopiae]
MDPALEFSPEPDLHPLHPTIPNIALLLSSHSGLAPSQKAELVTHCLTRACVFGDLQVLSYLISDSQAQAFVDLGIRDDEGLGLVSLTIHGFGSESDKDVEREECVRLLVSQGGSLVADEAGWTPLHHAALLSPPTLISYLMTHGCSPFDRTRRGLMPLDIVTAHSMLPGRDDVALLLEEAMRSEGWTGGKMEQHRRQVERRIRKKQQRQHIQDDVAHVLDLPPKWWGPSADSSSTDSDSSDEEDDINNSGIYTPPVDYASMLVFSPMSLPHIFDSIITSYQPSLGDAQPANVLYMLARFACLTCDHTWLEDLIIGATDAIEETFFNQGDDITCLVFWLYNTTIWLHLMQCDNSINEACQMLGSFELIEEVINSVFVFIIRFAERKIDQLLDATLLEYKPLASDLDSVQFESDWAFLRAFSSKKRSHTVTPSASASPLRTSTSPTRVESPAPSPSAMQASPSVPKGFSSLRHSFSRVGSSTTPIQSMFPESPPAPSPNDLTSFLTALQTLLVLSGINPAFSTQLWSQIMYWTSFFNRILTRKNNDFSSSSRATQIAMNLSVLEDWVDGMGLPRGVRSHFAPVRDLLQWLQCLSSITDFPVLIEIIQEMKCINPLQMRRAIRDYKYEVNEGRMTEECIQYLTQLQKDWERHRVKLGVEALRKEIDERDRDRESISSMQDTLEDSRSAPSIRSISSSTSGSQHGVDILFDKTRDKSVWEPEKAPQVLGELLDSRYMLPLLFPSDPRLLAALPGRLSDHKDRKSESGRGYTSPRTPDASSNPRRGSMSWRSRNKKIREVGIDVLQWVDGIPSAARWAKLAEADEEENSPTYDTADVETPYGEELTIRTNVVPLTRQPSGRSKGRASMNGELTPVE